MLPILLAIETGLDVTRNAAGYTGTGSVTLIVGRAIQIALGALGIVFILFLIYGGVLWMIARGDKTKVEQASRMLTNTTIALVVIVASYAIATYVVGALVQVTAG
ncbi:hypothetical protein A3D69_03795 [Candidatus Uhrbacteria bacterium RIFCSPHIGHO2_02_FULL_54_11]|nr:MAG: hypothetical protein A3D69_03795 [Candidatus Uhrbacteria bacterium RIFCSPHIGHO2_02_FULL_54_11]